MLNILWPVFIILSFIYAIITGKVNEVNNGIFDALESAVELSITFLGTISLWNGIMEIAKNTSLINKLTNILKPFIKRLFPELKHNEKANQEISINIIANILGLGNAATPLGIKAMKTMQEDNKKNDELSNSMMMFILLNTASLQLIPTNVIAIRTSLGSSNPTSIIIPVWISSIVAAIVGVLFVKFLIKKGKKMINNINYISSLAIPLTMMIIILYGLKEKKKTFDVFLSGAKEGIEIVVKMLPTLLGLFLAIGLLRSSGIIDFIVDLLTPLTELIKFPSQVMPLALLRPISGSASMAVAVDIMNNYGVDTLVGMITSVIMGSTETTLYTIAIYTSCVGIKKTRGVLFAALAADIAGMVISVFICRMLS